MTSTTSNLHIEELGSNDIISSLWSPTAIEKCKIGLADIILYDNGTPLRWYITGPNGEVKLKRSVEFSSINRRWVTISEQLASPYVAVVRQQGNISKFLTAEAWNAFLVENKPDPAIYSIHSYLGNGTNSIIYRSTYTYNVNSGRWILSTQTYTIPFQEPVHVCYEDNIRFIESKATPINKVTDMATTTVVRYVERMLKIQILKVSIDYVIDKKSQIWMLWTSMAKFHRGYHGSTQLLDENVTSPNRAKTPSTDDIANILSQQLKDISQTSNSNKLSMLNSIHNIQPTYDSTTTSPPKVTSFPNPYKCQGDYCNIDVQTSGPLATHPQVAKIHLAQKLFTDQEIIQLRKDPAFHSMLEFGVSSLGTQDISKRSILLAKKEKRGMLLANSIDSQSWKEYPHSKKSLTLTLDPNAPLASAGPTTMNSSTTSIQPDSFSSTVLTENGLEEDDFIISNPSRHYENVKVCNCCYRVYQCLDWARKILKPTYPFPEEMLSSNRPASSSMEMKETSGTHKKPRRTHDQSSNIISSTVDLGDIQQQTKPTSSKHGKRPHELRQSSSASASTWKDRMSRSPDRRQKRSELAVLDNYLRGKTNAIPLEGSQGSINQRRSPSPPRDGSKSMVKSKSTTSATVSSSSSASNVYHGKVLFACSDSVQMNIISQILQENQFELFWMREGRETCNAVIDHWEDYDCVIIERDLPLMNIFDITQRIREYEKTLRLQKSKGNSLSNPKQLNGISSEALNNHNKFLYHRMPIVCFTSQTLPQDLQKYMKADMDGCLSQPIDKISLLNTIRAAIPHHLAPLYSFDPSKEIEEIYKNSNRGVSKIGLLGELEGSVDSASMALKTLPITMKTAETCAEYQGIAQLDADTKLPFMIINGNKYSRMKNYSTIHEKCFNLVVCHDLFDTYERMKILLQPIIQKYQSIQILLWNYPGQAHTEWRSTQALSNEYLAACLNELLGQVGEYGTKDFATDHPFYILGYGFGANIAAYYLTHYRAANVRGLVSLNGWSFVDSYLAGVMHDCVNVFESTSDNRPDLPVYFFSRFLFSKDYLAKVSVPLALNIYTAVYNAITLAGRIQLCKGVLQSIDIRPLLKSLDCPLICIHSNLNSFIRPMHVEPYVTNRSGEVRSIHQALQYPSTTCVVWIAGGHEVFQENKKQTVLLLEQILTGYHEVHEVTFPSAASMSLDGQFSLTNQSKNDNMVDTKASLLGDSKKLSMEDKFTKQVLNISKKHGGDTTFNPSSSMTSLPSISSPQRTASPILGTRGTSRGNPMTASTMNSQPLGTAQTNRSLSPNNTLHNSSVDSWKSYSSHLLDKQHSILTLDTKNQQSKSKTQGTAKDSSGLPYLSDVQSFPEVKEYMNWRLKRNKKRLQRLQLAAQCIQNAFRAYMARKLVKNIRRLKAAMLIQRIFRGWRGRRKFFHHARRLWAAINLQRAWRGYAARNWYFMVRLKIAASAQIQRVFRGFLSRRRVKALRAKRNHAASVIQALFRRYKARKEAWRRRLMRNCATVIQRVFRGFLGKKRANAERDKYIFSKSQSQGIEFGRQMLLEHKLHVTRLQSDVTLLTQEKVASEEQIEALLEEISGFEEGVRSLEKEMHQLSKVEAEAAAFMDEDSKFELREQKMRLDREFGEMLSKIANRKEMLNDLERKLAAIDKTRQSKEEDLRTLERKLVVLLEDQQKELTAIRRKQDIRGAMLAASHNELSKATATGAGTVVNAAGGGGGTTLSLGGGGGSGPSLQEKKQAAQLMQSTETLMKFGFMSMSMTYFSSLNMIKALRTVSAQDTVMAALADVHAQRAVGFDGNSSVGGAGGGSVTSGGASASNPLLAKDNTGKMRKGQLPGQQSLQVSSWSVDDVAKWLQTLSLGQYSEAFIDAAVDGEFLYDLNDDDLKNTLGIEHRLHRKKILNCVNRLKLAEAQNDSRLYGLQSSGVLSENGTIDVNDISGQRSINRPNFDNVSFPDGNNDDRAIEGPKIPMNELFSLVRHAKFGLIKDALDYLPSKPFDKSLVQSNYVTDHGTVYLAGYERLAFHINKIDDHGNTMLSLACQNGNLKICKYLVSKGSNLNHQNHLGQTPAHFAIAYKFYDLSHWLFENGADDTLENKFGLTPYDGLSTEDDGGDGNGGGDYLAIED